MLVRQQRAQRFPYTTLFRSASAGQWPEAASGARLGEKNEEEPEQAASRQRAPCCLVRDELPDPRQRPTLCADQDRDRKSTRLNSSHVEISYAVFCLKKKRNL